MMKASIHNYRQCADDDGMLCPTCEFRERLNASICRASDGSEKAWNTCQGDLADQMFDALYALHRSRRERFTDRHDEIANAWESATRLVEVPTPQAASDGRRHLAQQGRDRGLIAADQTADQRQPMAT
jgi:hypothetical protein